MSYTFINPAYVERGREAMAEAFDAILSDALPAWAAEMSEGYAWQRDLPEPDKFVAAAAALAAHLRSEYAGA
jgi:hypothetical protein